MVRYFHGRSWQECDGDKLPKDASLLVRSVGTDNVRDLEEGIRAYESQTGKVVPYIMAAERKDDVQFYVPKDELADLRKFLIAKLGEGKK